MTKKDKTWLIVGGGITAAILIYRISSSKVDNGGAMEDPTGNGSVGQLPAYTFNAGVVAEKLYNAMRETGTKVPDIFNALAPVSISQFNQVISAFQARSYNELLGNQYNFNPFTNLPLRNLQFWLKKELSTQDYGILAKKFPQL